MIGLQPESSGPPSQGDKWPFPNRGKWPQRAEYITTARRRAMDNLRSGKSNLAFMQFCAEICVHPELKRDEEILLKIKRALLDRREGKLNTFEKLSVWFLSFEK